MTDHSIDTLMKLAIANIQKAAFVSGEETQQAIQQQAQMPVDPNTGQPMDPAMAQQMGMDPSMQGGQPMDPSMQGGQPMDPAAQGGQPMDSSMQGAQPMPPEAGQQAEVADPAQADQEGYAMLVDAVRQVLGEMGIDPQQAQPAAEQQPKPKSRGAGGGKVDGEDFARLQSAVALILKHLGLVDEQEALMAAIEPIPPEPEEAAQQQPAAQEEQVPADAGTGMGAHPGEASDLPAQAQSLAGPLDPNAGEAMAMAGTAGRQSARRASKMAQLIRRSR
jgi:hypothetical protein